MLHSIQVLIVNKQSLYHTCRFKKRIQNLLIIIVNKYLKLLTGNWKFWHTGIQYVYESRFCQESYCSYVSRYKYAPNSSNINRRGRVNPLSCYSCILVWIYRLIIFIESLPAQMIEYLYVNLIMKLSYIISKTLLIQIY